MSEADKPESDRAIVHALDETRDLAGLAPLGGIKDPTIVSTPSYKSDGNMRVTAKRIAIFCEAVGIALILAAGFFELFIERPAQQAAANARLNRIENNIERTQDYLHTIELSLGGRPTSEGAIRYVDIASERVQEAGSKGTVAKIDEDASALSDLWKILFLVGSAFLVIGRCLQLRDDLKNK